MKQIFYRVLVILYAWLQLPSVYCRTSHMQILNVHPSLHQTKNKHIYITHMLYPCTTFLSGQ